MAQNSEIEKLERRWADNPLGLTFAPLAEAYRRAGDHSMALEVLTAGLATHAGYVPALIVQARCHLDAGLDGEAERRPGWSETQFDGHPATNPAQGDRGHRW
jgi:hypothetical protein